MNLLVAALVMGSGLVLQHFDLTTSQPGYPIVR
jgi:hypothetical protein